MYYTIIIAWIATNNILIRVYAFIFHILQKFNYLIIINTIQKLKHPLLVTTKIQMNSASQASSNKK